MPFKSVCVVHRSVLVGAKNTDMLMVNKEGDAINLNTLSTCSMNLINEVLQGRKQVTSTKIRKSTANRTKSGDIEHQQQRHRLSVQQTHSIQTHARSYEGLDIREQSQLASEEIRRLNFWTSPHFHYFGSCKGG